MNINTENTKSFSDFLNDTRKKANRLLNRLLWFCVLAGPAIALEIGRGVFFEITYATCALISGVMLLLAVFHYLMLKKWPYFYGTSIFAILAMNLLLVYIETMHINIYLAWFLAPLLSLLFCDYFLYAVSTVVNYLLMFTATWVSASYHAQRLSEPVSPMEYFRNNLGSYTIEYLIMAVAGLAVLKMITDYLRELTGHYRKVTENEEQILERTQILSSMAEIYEKVNLIDFQQMTEMSLREEKLMQIGIDLAEQDHTNMTQKMMRDIMPEHLSDFVLFTDITTVRDRLFRKRSISGEFISITVGWFRAQYISVEQDENQYPVKIIFTIQNIDNDKRREEHLIRIAMTDELTMVHNRRSYDEAVAAIQEGVEPIDPELAIFSVDLNGLKEVNDELGHIAGDELIKATASCLMMAAGTNGKVFRTGGDEFMMIVTTPDCEQFREEIERIASEWNCEPAPALSFSIGYAAVSEQETPDLVKLEKLADQRMYDEKSRYYSSSGKDRRKQRRG